MALTGRRGVWQSATELSERMPLRVKLITAMLVLVALALAAISLVGISVLRSNLLGNVDATVAQHYYVVEHQLNNGGFSLALRPAVGVGEAVIWVPDRGSPSYLEIPVSASGFAAGSYGQQLAGPSLTASQASSLPTNPLKPVTVGSANGSTRWRVIGIPSTANGADTTATHGTIVVAVDATGAYNTIGELSLIDLVVSLVVLLALALAGVAVVRASLRPLIEIEQTAGTIAAGDLSRRVPDRDPGTEVGRLGRSLNVMLSQIESAFRAREQSEESARRSEEKMRQFVADASHELRTPLTAMRGFAEYYRHRGGISTNGNEAGQLTAADLDRIMRRVEQEASRMGILVEDMLLLARLDQQRPLEAQPVDLLTLAADAVHDARVVAPDRSINLTVGSGAALLVIGDEVRLRQVIGNLMSNALSHTPAGTPIDVTIRSGNLDEAPPPPEPTEQAKQVEPAAADGEPQAGVPPAGEPPAGEPPAGEPPAGEPPVSGTVAGRPVSQPAAVLEVRDHGPGLTAEQAEHVFERFYRADQARTSGGTGLGLAIVAALVAAHGGTTWVRSKPGEGAMFSIALPLSPEAAEGSDDDFADAEDEPDERTAMFYGRATEPSGS
jgi:two-component system OmpR family sensor kinase